MIMNNSESKIILPYNQLSEDIAVNKLEREAKSLANKLLEADKQKQADIEARLEGLEILPSGARIVVMPYPKNPYRQIFSKGGIITEYNGSFKNPDSGEEDTLETGIVCGKVIEVGPESKEVRIGDDVYYDKRTVYPLPFMSLGYVIFHETQALAIINNGLKERFGMNNE